MELTAFTLGVKWFENRSFSSSRKSPISERPRDTLPAFSVEKGDFELPLDDDRYD